MATWDDVRRLALGLPETSESTTRGNASWLVRDKMFAWERPLGKSDLAAIGSAAPDGPILGVRVPDAGAKAALLAEEADWAFTIPHFNGYPAVLVLLDRIPLDALREVLVEAWFARAPKRLAAGFDPTTDPATSDPPA